jgi:hypothetical protein
MGDAHDIVHETPFRVAPDCVGRLMADSGYMDTFVQPHRPPALADADAEAPTQVREDEDEKPEYVGKVTRR